MQKILEQIITDLKVKLSEEFDRNFERKGFFEQNGWAKPMFAQKNSVLNQNGILRSSIKCRKEANGLRFISSAPYAVYHNEGANVKVTAESKRYFWAMYYKAIGGTTYSIKRKKMNNTIRNRRLTREAEMYKALALKKVGSTISIPKRQFIGPHPEVDQMVKKIVHDNIQELNAQILKQLKP
jgi:phage gpG-like protein